MEDSVYTYGAGARNCDEQEETSSLMHNQATESKATEWTDEKHSMYLKSMEATFVNQLYKSLNLTARDKNSQSGSKSSKNKHSIRAPSSQFKVLRDGHWSKIDFRRDEAAEINQEKSSKVLFANPWVQHYRSSQRHQARKALATTNQDSANDSVGTEGTDQNFSDEDLVEEKSNGIYEMKKTRTTTDTVLGNDQVVPFENTVQANDDAEDQNRISC